MGVGRLTRWGSGHYPLEVRAKSNSKPLLKRGERGVTTLEIILAVAVVGILSMMTFPIFQNWRTAASTKTCIYNVSRIQETMRVYTGLNNLVAGAPISNSSFLGGTTGLIATPVCGTGSAYTYMAVVPITGQAYASCPVGTAHTPTTTAGW